MNSESETDRSQYGHWGESSSGDTGQPVTEQVRQGTQQVVQQTQQAASQAVDQVQTQATSMLDSQRDKAAQGLSEVTRALQATSKQLRDQGQSAHAGVVDSASDKLTQVSTYLQNHDTRQIIWDVEDTARRNSTLFLGGAFALGILAARFLKSSAPSRSASDGYSGGYGYRPSNGYGGGYRHSGGQPSRYTGTGQYGQMTDNQPYGYDSGSASMPSTYDVANPPYARDNVGETPEVRIGYAEGLMGDTEGTDIDASKT